MKKNPCHFELSEIEEQIITKVKTSDKISLLGVFEVPPIVDSQVDRKLRGLLNLTRPVLQTMSSGEEHVSSDLQRERKLFQNLE